MGTNRFTNKLVIDQYEQHYFSGSQCRIYFNGVHVVDINYLDYSIASNKAPIYSYNDPYYKVVARGNYLVQGTFTINFSDREKMVMIDKQIQMLRPSERVNDIKIDALKGDDSIFRYFASNNLSGKDKDAIANRYKDEYWGSRLTGRKARYIRPDEWDLLSNGDLDPDGFNIVMVYGYPHGSMNQFATKQLNRVHITGEAMVTADNGQPIAIQYQYFARSIDGETDIYHEQSRDADLLQKDKVSTTPSDTTIPSIANYDYLRTYPIRFDIVSMWEGIDKTTWNIQVMWRTDDSKIKIGNYGYWNSYTGTDSWHPGRPENMGTTFISGIPSSTARVSLRSWKFILQHDDDKNNGRYESSMIDYGNGINNSCTVDKPAI